MTDQNILFIVNPNSRGGDTGKKWEKTYSKINDMLKFQSEYKIADGIGSGREIALDAANSGDFDLIVAVGGEGSINEVCNGLYESKNDVPLGFIKGGTVNDYLKIVGWPKTLEEQVARINTFEFRDTPLVRATGDISRMFLNIGDIGLTSNVGKTASIDRKLKWIKSGFRYTLLALREILTWNNIPTTIKTEDNELQGNLNVFMAGFSSEIGTYKIIPHAKPYAEKMAYAAAMDWSKFDMLTKLNMVKKGKHTNETRGITLGYSDKITVEAENGVGFIMSVDGEPFTFDSPKIEYEAVHNAIRIVKAN